MTLVGITFSASGRDRAVELADLLDLLGSAGQRSSWCLRHVEVAPSPAADRIHELSDRREAVDGSELSHLAAGVQVIDGEFEARMSAAPEPWIVLRAVDGTSWDVLSSDERVLASMAEQFSDASPL